MTTLRTDYPTIWAAVAYALVDPDELDALHEAVEVIEDSSWCGTAFEQLYEKLAIHSAALEAVELLEDMLAQRDAEAERWFWKWYHAHEGKADWEADAHFFEALSNDYARRLKATDEAFRKLQVSRDYTDDRLRMVRERVKTYRKVLDEIAAFSNNGGATLARHVLASEIRDGGADF